MSAQEIKIRKNDVTRKRSPGGASLMVLFSATIFVSAALLFLIEPMFAKFVLPSFGGTPAVWTGSMMFFQAALLTSYLYVHATTMWLGARRQAILHLVVVALPLLLFVLSGPIDVPAKQWAPSAGSNPLFSLLGLLAVAIGLPFFAVSATNPLIQRWLADTDHPSAKDPYFLYRASNLGSVIGLLGYPLVVERELKLVSQGWMWTLGYGLLVVLVFASAVMLWRSAPASVAERAEELEPLAGDPASGGGSLQSADLSLGWGGPTTGAPTLLRRLRWIGLTFVPSSLMLGVTSFITTDLAPVPLLWVVPLSLYLFSFVMVFSPSQRMPALIHKVMVALMPITMAVLVVTMLIGIRDPLWLFVGLHLVGFFVVAIVLHGEVARDRPPARYLTEFYLWVAVGGVLGGVFNALIAPVAFKTVAEYPLAIVLACLFLPGVILPRMLRNESAQERSPGEESNDDEEQHQEARGGGSSVRPASRLSWLTLALDVVLPLAVGLALVALGWTIKQGTFASIAESHTVWWVFLSLAAGVCLWFAYSSRRPIRFGLGIAALIVAANFIAGTTNLLYADRSFFGVYTVKGNEASHTLVFGNTTHGTQIFGTTPPVPTSYYHRTGPVGQLFDALPDEVTSRPAVIGLGTGTMACYNKPGQQLTFYEIDPLVERIARNTKLFTYLRDCPGETNVVLGDARLSLANAPDKGYGVIVTDAFSSDAIPVHLMTREAIDLYFQKLQSDGVLAMHISNRHLDLEPVLGNVAQDAGLACRAQFDGETQGEPGKFPSNWVVMARQEDDLANLANKGRWQPCRTYPAWGVWTDDFSNLISTFLWN
jgi:hypothetical protein